MRKRATSTADLVLETRESTMLDVLDELLNRGVMADGDVMLGLAGVDLIYLRLSALLCAADRVLAPGPVPAGRRVRRPSPRRSKTRR